MRRSCRDNYEVGHFPTYHTYVDIFFEEAVLRHCGIHLTSNFDSPSSGQISNCAAYFADHLNACGTALAGVSRIEDRIILRGWTYMSHGE